MIYRVHGPLYSGELGKTSPVPRVLFELRLLSSFWARQRQDGTSKKSQKLYVRQQSAVDEFFEKIAQCLASSSFDNERVDPS